MVSISNFLIISIPLTIESLNRGKSFVSSISFNSTVNLICCPIKIESLSTKYLADWLNKFRDKIDTNRSQGILIKAQVSTFSSLPKTEKINSCYVILDQVQDPHNLGQILRICAGGSIDGVIITERNSVSMTSAVAQVSQGGFAKIPLFSVTNINQAITHFKKDDFWITSFENNIDAKDWYKIDLKGRSILIFGGEGNGVSKQVLKNSDFTATIPMSNQMNSLNVSSAVSAIVFERLRQVSI